MKRVLMLSLFLCAIAGAQSVTLTPSKDTDVYSFGNGGFPTSTSFTLGVNSTPASYYPESHSQRSFIQFNTSGVTIPAAEVGKAVLRVFVVMPDPSFGTLAPGNVHVHAQASDWGAITATTPKWVAFQSAGEIGTIPITANSMETWVEVEITSTVVAWLNGSLPNHGVFLAPQSEFMTPGINVTFTSMEVPGYQPQLVITRKVVPPALTIAISGNGSVTLQWPITGSTGWILQRAESPAGPWVANTATVSNSGGTYQLQPTMIGKEFFRLAKQ